MANDTVGGRTLDCPAHALGRCVGGGSLGRDHLRSTALASRHKHHGRILVAGGSSPRRISIPQDAFSLDSHCWGPLACRILGRGHNPSHRWGPLACRTLGLGRIPCHRRDGGVSGRLRNKGHEAYVLDDLARIPGDRQTEEKFLPGRSQD